MTKKLYFLCVVLIGIWLLSSCNKQHNATQELWNGELEDFFFKEQDLQMGWVTPFEPIEECFNKENIPEDLTYTELDDKIIFEHYFEDVKRTGWIVYVQNEGQVTGCDIIFAEKNQDEYTALCESTNSMVGTAVAEAEKAERNNAVDLKISPYTYQDITDEAGAVNIGWDFYHNGKQAFGIHTISLLPMEGDYLEIDGLAGCYLRLIRIVLLPDYVK